MLESVLRVLKETSFSTTSGFVDYSLTMSATNYTLRGNGAVILSGPVRDYTAFTGFPDPYTTPNFIFFGDDTTSASASMNLRRVALIMPPRLTMGAPGTISWSGVSNQTYHVQVSTNLTDWNSAAATTSLNNSFQFTTNTSQPHQYFRVVFP